MQHLTLLCFFGDEPPALGQLRSFAHAMCFAREGAVVPDADGEHDEAHCDAPSIVAPFLRIPPRSMSHRMQARFSLSLLHHGRDLKEDLVPRPILVVSVEKGFLGTLECRTWLPSSSLFAPALSEIKQLACILNFNNLQNVRCVDTDLRTLTLFSNFSSPNTFTVRSVDSPRTHIWIETGFESGAFPMAI